MANGGARARHRCRPDRGNLHRKVLGRAERGARQPRRAARHMRGREHRCLCDSRSLPGPAVSRAGLHLRQRLSGFRRLEPPETGRAQCRPIEAEDRDGQEEHRSRLALDPLLQRRPERLRALAHVALALRPAHLCASAPVLPDHRGNPRLRRESLPPRDARASRPAVGRRGGSRWRCLRRQVGASPRRRSHCHGLGAGQASPEGAVGGAGRRDFSGGFTGRARIHRRATQAGGTTRTVGRPRETPAHRPCAFRRRDPLGHVQPRHPSGALAARRSPLCRLPQHGLGRRIHRQLPVIAALPPGQWRAGTGLARVRPR